MSNESVVIAKAPKKVQNGMDNLIDIKLRITQGKALAMFNALEAVSETSPVGRDLLDMLQRAAADHLISI
jgi:hypothetical protein